MDRNFQHQRLFRMWLNSLYKENDNMENRHEF